MGVRADGGVRMGGEGDRVPLLPEGELADDETQECWRSLLKRTSRQLWISENKLICSLLFSEEEEEEESGTAATESAVYWRRSAPDLSSR